jgi:thymidylate synthase
LSGDPSIDKLGEINGSIPPIWENMADSDRKVRSNYGWQWERNHQLDKVVAMLKSNPETRQAVISIYDGKEISTYRKDTPCTYAVQFTVLDNKLHMAVLMRSNDLWFGFCNDQYCFASLQELVAERLSIELGTYYHFAHNLHLYNNKLK